MGGCMCSERDSYPNQENLDDVRFKMLNEYLQGLKSSYIITLDESYSAQSYISSPCSQENSNLSVFDYSEDESDYEIPSGLRQGEIFVFSDGTKFRLEKKFKNTPSRGLLICQSCSATVSALFLKNHVRSDEHAKNLKRKC